MNINRHRCEWAGTDPLYIAYHDTEWGVPVHDDRTLFEFLILDGFQAGLSWITILKKRQGFRKAFDDFDAQKIVKYDAKKITELLSDPCIVRNRLKIESVVSNARSFLRICEACGSFDAYLWRFVEGKTIRNAWKHVRDIPTMTKESKRMSQDLQLWGFRFVGPTICYAFMQAAGMVNDHTVDCFRYGEV